MRLLLVSEKVLILPNVFVRVSVARMPRFDMFLKLYLELLELIHFLVTCICAQVEREKGLPGRICQSLENQLMHFSSSPEVSEVQGNKDEEIYNTAFVLIKEENAHR